MKRLFILGFCPVFCLLIFAFGASVSAQPTVKPVIVQKPITIPSTIDAGKLFSREKLRLPNLNPADKLKIVNEQLKDKGMTTVNSLSPAIKITTVNPKPSEQNYLIYFKPWNAMVIGDSVQFSGAKSFMDSSLGVVFKPSAPGTYLFDLSVKKIGAMEFTVLTLDGKTNQTLKYPSSGEKYAHITFLVEVPNTEQRAVLVYADSDWSFWDVEISQAK